MSDPTPRPETGDEGGGSLPYMPIFLDLTERTCLVLGGSEAAAAKVALLRRAGAEVRLVADALCPDLATRVREGDVTRIGPAWDPAQLVGAALVVDDGCDEDRLAAVRAACTERGVLLNVIDRPESCDFIVPAVLDRSPVVVAVSTGGAAPALARMIRQRLERAIPPGVGGLARLARAYRERVKARLTSPRARQRFWDDALDPDALAGLDEPAARARLDAMLDAASADDERQAGEVTLVGAGPGDPGLLTLAAARAIERADVILHDALVSPEVLELARREARRVPVGKRAGRPSVAQAMIERMMVAHARRGLRVVRLKGGDPFVFGRGGEELAHLRAAGICARVVPGVTAALGCAAEAGIPLTHRGMARSLRLVTASCRSGVESAAIDWARAADPGGTLAIYMGGGQLHALAAGLLEGGLAPTTPAVAIENGTLTGARRCFAPLAALAETAAATLGSGPALVLIGQTVALADGWRAAPLPQSCAVSGEVSRHELARNP